MAIEKPEKRIRAAIVGRLLLEEFDTWDAFENATNDYAGNRKQRRAKRSYIGSELRKFLKQNFEGATEAKLASMWTPLREKREIRCNMPDFEKDFFKIRANRRKGVPDHALVVISLWGLGFDFPEKQLADSLAESVSDLKIVLSQESAIDVDLRIHRKKREEIRKIPRRIQHCCRSILFFCHALVECYLSGLAWEFLKESDTGEISNRERAKLEDQVRQDFRQRLEGHNGLLFSLHDAGIPGSILDAIEGSKEYRDSITHPSPFGFKSTKKSVSAFEKLNKFYDLDPDFVLKVARSTFEYLDKIETHRNGARPFWLDSLYSTIDDGQA